MSEKFSLSKLLGGARSQSFADFAMGKIYPFIFVFLALLGHTLGVEVFTINVATVLAVFALIFAPTARPLIPYAMTIVFHISRINAPGVPTNSTFLTSGWGLDMNVFSFVLLMLGMVYFVLRRRLYRFFKMRHLAVIIPLLVFSLFITVNGVFSSEWTPASLLYGFAVGFFLSLVFLFFFYGLKRDERVAKYISYVACLVVGLLLLELAFAYYDAGVIDEAQIIKSNIVFGWGVWNSMGMALLQLIPLVFIGALSHSKKKAFGYLLIAMLALFGIMFTLSRGALIFGVLVFVGIIIFMAFASHHKVIYRVLAIVSVVIVIAAFIVMGERSGEILGELFDDNGRFDLFLIGLKNFLDAPIFGVGFFGFKFPDDPNYFAGASFLPAMAHQHIIELLSASGILGVISYLGYRVSTVLPLFKEPSQKKVLLFLSAFTVVLMSIFDNFIFSIWPTVTYSIALAAMMNEHSHSHETPEKH